MDSNNPEHTPISYHKFYMACRNIAWTLSAVCTLSLFLSAIPSPPQIKFLEQFLKVLFLPDAMAETVMLVGLPGVVATVLISRMLDRVCGVQMSELVDDSYPYFFSFYFGAFMCLAIAGVLMGKAGFFWPTFYAFLGVLIAFAGLCFVCFALLIHSTSQKDLILSYYKRQFCACQRERSQGKQEGDYELRRLFQNTAEYARMILLQDHQDRLPEIVRLWLDVFSDQDSLAQRSSRLSGSDNSILQDSTLCAAGWAALLPEGAAAPQDAEILHDMLRYLDRAVLVDDDSGRYSYGRTALLLGLAQFLTGISRDIPDQDAKQLCALTYGRQDCLADQDLTCACLIMRIVEWLDGSSSAQKDLVRAVQLLQTMLDRSLLKAPPDLTQASDSSLSYFLYCAESIACCRLCMDSNEFFLRAAEKLDASSETVGISAYLTAKEQRAVLFTCLLRQVCMGETTASARQFEESTKKPAALSEKPDRPVISPRPVHGSQDRLWSRLRLNAIPHTSQPSQKTNAAQGLEQSLKRRPDKPWPKLKIIPLEPRPNQEAKAAMGTEMSQETEV